MVEPLVRTCMFSLFTPQASDRKEHTGAGTLGITRVLTGYNKTVRTRVRRINTKWYVLSQRLLNIAQGQVQGTKYTCAYSRPVYLNTSVPHMQTHHHRIPLDLLKAFCIDAPPAPSSRVIRGLSLAFTVQRVVARVCGLCAN
jgi:hypothetical protein